MTTAGRRLVADWSVNGKATSSISPNSKGVIDAVVGIAPDGGESGFRSLHRGLHQLARFVAAAQEIHEIVNLGDKLRRELIQLLDQSAFRLRVHVRPSFSRYAGVPGFIVATSCT